MTEIIHTLGGNAIEILSKPRIIGRRVDIFIFELEIVCGRGELQMQITQYQGYLSKSSGSVIETNRLNKLDYLEINFHLYTSNNLYCDFSIVFSILTLVYFPECSCPKFCLDNI